MRVILDFPDPEDQPSVIDVRCVLSALPEGTILGVNDAGHGNVLLDRLRREGIRCERWFKAACGLRRKEG